MSNILNISSKNSYLTSKQWKEVVRYVKNRSNITEEFMDEKETQTEEKEKVIEVKHSKAYEKLIQETSVSDMYMTLLTIMNEEPEILYEITEDELLFLYNIATQMNKENPSNEYIDLVDTLQYLAGDYDLNGAVTLTDFSSYSLLSSSGGTLSSGKYYLNNNITITNTIKISSGSEVVIDLNGYVLSVNSGFIFNISNGGSLIIEDSSPETPHYGTVTNGVWEYDSSAISGIEIKGGIITGGTGDRGGAVLTSGIFTLNNGTIAGCVAQETDPDQENELHIITGGAGGAVYIQADSNGAGQFIMNGGNIKYCSSDPDISSLGGAVFIDCEGSNAGLFIMNDGVIEYCRSTSGGAVYVHKSLAEDATAVGVFEMTGGEISNNASKGDGGGIYVTGKFIMNGGKIYNNQTLNTGTLLDGVQSYKYYGGGVYAVGTSAIIIINDGEISNNSAASGGGVMVYTGSSLTMNGGIISNNIACGSGGLGNGGAIYVASGVFNFNKGILQNNYARRYGGAININQTSTMNLNGECKILNNSANHGGGISQESGDCQIELSNENILISGNTAKTMDYEDGAGGGGTGNGGGLFIEKGTLNFSAGTITGNTATGRGGGISMCVKRIGGDISVNMTGGNIINNTANSTGGGIDIFSDYEDTTGTINNVAISLCGGLIDNNRSDDNGGGVQVWINEENSKSSILIGQSISDMEPVITNNYSYTNGGAVSIASGDIIMSKGLLYNNSAKNNGGSIYVDGGNFTMKSGSFDKNTAEISGGAIYVADGDISIESGAIINNVALNNGGAITVTSGNLTIGTRECYETGESSTHSHPIIESNIALNGGGIYVDGGITTMWCGDIKRNLTYDKTVNVLVVSGGNFIYNGGTIGIPYDSGVFVNGGIFEDNTSESNETVKHELHYHSILGQETHNGKIPESKWIASPRGDVLYKEDCDETSPTWADLFPNYEFVGWESHAENDTDEIINLYAIWEER